MTNRKQNTDKLKFDNKNKFRYKFWASVLQGDNNINEIQMQITHLHKLRFIIYPFIILISREQIFHKRNWLSLFDEQLIVDLKKKNLQSFN